MKLVIIAAILFVGLVSSKSFEPTQDKIDSFLKKHPLVGSDDHDNQKGRKGKEQLKNHKGREREKKHHSDIAWKNRLFSIEQIAPLLEQKLPEFMKNAKIISVKNNGFIAKKGYSLNIQIKNFDNKMQIISAYFKPRKQEFYIDKILPIKNEQIEKIPVEITDQSKNLKAQPLEENLIAPKQDFIQSVLGGEKDSINDIKFMALVTEFALNQVHKLNQQKQDQLMKIPLLGGQHDLKRQIDESLLSDDSSDEDFVDLMAQNLQQKNQLIFDVQGQQLPGGKTDIDHEENMLFTQSGDKSKAKDDIGVELIGKVVEMIQDINEDEIKDIDEVPELNKDKKTEKMELLTN